MSTLTKEQDRPATTTTERPVNFITPLANIRETKDGFVLEAEMPGVNKSGLEVTVENGQLIILGRRSDRETTGEHVYRESRWLDYRRVFDLDTSIDASKISAKMDQGVLTLHLPKAEEVKPRKITVS